jgi:hypothetical protein
MSFEGHERRADTRYVVAIPSIVQPLDEAYQLQDNRFFAATRDISMGGIALIHTQPLTAEFAGVKLTLPDGTSIELLVEVLRAGHWRTTLTLLASFFSVRAESWQWIASRCLTQHRLGRGTPAPAAQSEARVQSSRDGPSITSPIGLRVAVRRCEFAS